MTIYDPTIDGTGVFSGGEFGKDAPFYSPIKGYGYKLYGPSTGRFGAYIKGAQYVYRYFRKNPRFGARIGAVAGGALVKYASQNARPNKFNQTLRSSYSSNYRKRKQFQLRHGGCCCKRCC